MCQRGKVKPGKLNVLGKISVKNQAEGIHHIAMNTWLTKQPSYN
jgi:hypothetical protein